MEKTLTPEQEYQIDRVINFLEGPYDCVYFLKAGEYIKIGYTKGRLFKRIADLQVGNPIKIEIEHFMAGSRVVEKKLHRIFKKYKVSGEWFKINKADIFEAIKNL